MPLLLIYRMKACCMRKLFFSVEEALLVELFSIDVILIL